MSSDNKIVYLWAEIGEGCLDWPPTSAYVNIAVRKITDLIIYGALVLMVSRPECPEEDHFNLL